MKRNYWALLVFVLIIVLQWIGLGFYGQIRFNFFDNYISSNCFIGNIIAEIVKVNSEVIVCKKLIASVLTLVCILTLARCGKSDSGDYPATIMVNGTNYYSTDHAVPVEVDESVIQYTTSYAENGIPQKDGEANFNRDLGTPYAVIEDDSVVVLIDNEWIEFKAK